MSDCHVFATVFVFSEEVEAPDEPTSCLPIQTSAPQAPPSDDVTWEER